MKELIKKIVNVFTDHQFHGCIQIMLSGYFTLYFGQLWYNYHFTDIQYYGMFPDWSMMILMILSIVGVITGISVFFDKLRKGVAYLFQLCYLCLGVVLHIFTFG